MDKEKLAKVAVIIPSLNSARYIDECIQSVQNQSLKDLQILCVDAKSEDGTLEILAHYAKNDDRIQIIVSDKKSYGYQMNLGIKAAKAEYIGIVESDDYIKVRMYEELYSLAKAKDCEVVKSDILRFSGEKQEKKFTLNPIVYDKNFYGKIISYQKNGIKVLKDTWNMNQSGIYSLEFLKKSNIAFNETPGASYQDTGFWFQVFSLASSIYIHKDAYYCYRGDNENSSCHSKEKVYCICEEYDFIDEFIAKNKLEGLKEIALYLRFGGYKWNLNRIDTMYRLEFLQKFALDFQKMQDRLDKKLFRPRELLELQRIMRNPQEYYDNVVKKPKGAVERVKNHLAYKLGFAIIKAKNPLKFLLLPFNIAKISMDHRFEQKIIKILLKLKPEFRPLPLDQYSDSEDSLRVKEHLSYKLGKALLKNPLTFIFKISGIYKDYKRNKK